MNSPELLDEQAESLKNPSVLQLFKEDVNCVFKRDPAARTRAEIITTYHGVTLGGVSWNKGKRHPTLGDGEVVGAGAKILGPISIGKDARVGANSVVIFPVPDDCNVVGIPGKVVQSRHAANASVEGTDLNQHLIPDPVAEAVSCLLERIRLLEQKVGTHGCIPGGEVPEDECDHCDAKQVCEPVNVELQEVG